MTTSHAPVEGAVSVPEAILNRIDVGLLVVDSSGVIHCANRWLHQAVGKPDSWLVGQPVTAVFPEIEGTRLERAITECIAHRRSAYLTPSLNPKLFPLRAQEHARTEGYMSQLVRITPFDLDGFEGGALIQVEDTTQSHVREQLLRSMTKELEARVEERTVALRQAEKMEAVGQIAGGVAHDFNNMLTVILGNLELLQELADDREERDYYLDIVRQAALNGAEIANRLLSFSRREPRNVRSVELSAAAGSITGLIASSVGSRISVETDLAPNLPPIRVDVNELQNAILNLTINSRDAMPQGGVITLRTRLGTMARRGVDLSHGLEPIPRPCVRLEVIDTGEGIPEELSDRVLEPFFTTKAEGKGTGLGLAMVYRFAEESDGQVKIASVPGSGTKVVLSFPIDPSGQLAAAGEPGAEEVERRTVLVVEDESALRDLVEVMLASLGYLVRTAAGPALALDILQGSAGGIDLVVSDVVMPGPMDGVQLAKEIRERYPAVATLLVSGYPRSGATSSDHFLAKPFTRTQLAEAVEEALSSSRSH